MELKFLFDFFKNMNYGIKLSFKDRI